LRKKQGALDRKGFRDTNKRRQNPRVHDIAVRIALWCQSRSLFIRTMTVGPGIKPGLLTLHGSEAMQALAG
jgi:hypothetical protein